MRRKPGQFALVALTTTLMLFMAAAPGLHALLPADRSLSGDWIRQRLNAQDENVIRAIEAALETAPATLDEFVAAVIVELDGSDDAAARAALSLVIPAMSLEHFLSGGWLVELRQAAKLARSLMPRAPGHFLSAATVLSRTLRASIPVTWVGRLAQGPNLTSWQIRYLIAALPLGP
jgi:hypothetical protein